MPARTSKKRQESDNPFVDLILALLASREAGVRPGDPGAFEQFLASPAAGFVGPGVIGKGGRGGVLSQNRAGREKLTKLFESLGKSKPKQLKRTSPQGNKKLRETVANEEPNPFRPEGEGFMGSFKGPAFMDPFMASLMKGPRLQGLPSVAWYTARGIPLEVRKMHAAILGARKVKVGEVLELPFPAMKRGMRRDPDTGKRIGGIRVEKTASDAVDADILQFTGKKK